MVEMIVFGVGHVVVADVERHEDPYLGPVFLATTAATVRKWETSRGLGELADGPKQATLDGIVHGLKIPIQAIHGIWPLTDVGRVAWGKAISKSSQSVLRG